MRLETYLTFNRQCKEAFEFYAALMGGKIEGMMTDKFGVHWMLNCDPTA